MKDYAKTLKTLIILDKLLKQDLISLKKSWSDADVIKEINDELKRFISNKLDSMIKTGGVTATTDLSLEGSMGKVTPTLSTEVKVVTKPTVDALIQKGFNPAAELKERIEFIKKQELEQKGKK